MECGRETKGTSSISFFTWTQIIPANMPVPQIYPQITHYRHKSSVKFVRVANGRSRPTSHIERDTIWCQIMDFQGLSHTSRVFWITRTSINCFRKTWTFGHLRHRNSVIVTLLRSRKKTHFLWKGSLNRNILQITISSVYHFRGLIYQCKMRLLCRVDRRTSASTSLKYRNT